MKTFTYSLALFLVILFSCAPRQEKKSNTDNSGSNRVDTIRISSCFSCERLTKKWIEEFNKTHSDIHFRLLTNESASCVSSLSNGSHIAVISRDLLQEEDTLSYCVSSVAKHGVVVIINEDNPYIDVFKDGVTKESIIEVYHQRTWNPIAKENRYPINFYFRAPRAGNTWNLAIFLDLNPDSLFGTSVVTDLDMVESIRNDRYGLGYCSHINAYDLQTNAQVSGIKVVPIKDDYGNTHHFYDSLNLMKRAIWNGKYQFHLYPTIYIVVKEKPSDPDIRGFLRWVFTDGQQIVEKEGYIKLRQSEVGCRIKDL